MVALRTSLTTLTLFGASELLVITVKLLNRPALGVLSLDGLRVDGVWSIGDDPVNVAVCGDYLEQSNQERQLFEFDHDPILEAVRCPVNILEVNVTLLTAQRYQAVVLNGRKKDHFQESHELKVVHARVPTIEQHGLGFDTFAVFRCHQHLAK